LLGELGELLKHGRVTRLQLPLQGRLWACARRRRRRRRRRSRRRMRRRMRGDG
jgi:hypothetical protein